jgi:hypothetical protein
LSRVSLGIIGLYVPAELVDAAVSGTERGERRWRSLPSRLGVYFVLALCLSPTTCYGATLRAMIGPHALAQLAALGWRPVSSTALSKLRDRIGALPLERLFTRLAGRRPTVTRSWSHAFGLLVCAWDGTEIALGDTAALARRFPRHRGRDGACGTPKARVLVLIACGTRLVIDAVIGGLGPGEGEVSLAHRLAHRLRPDMLLLADRAFLGYRLWTAARAGGAHLLWRAKQNKPRLPVQTVLPDGSFLSRMIDPVDARAWRERVRANRKRGHAPPRPRLLNGVTVRVVEALITVTVDGVTRTGRYLLVTSLLDPRRAPAEQLVALYARRWAAETGIREIKTVVLAGRAPRGATPIRARQELWAALIVYQALRMLVCQAAMAQELDPSSISFTAARDAAGRMIATTPGSTASLLSGVCQDLCRQQITRHTGYRIFPRALKNTLTRYPYRGTKRPLTSGRASLQAQIVTPASTDPTPTSSPSPAQPRAA